MTDKERILMGIIRKLSSTQVRRCDKGNWSSDIYYDESSKSYLTHFAYWDKYELKVRDLVLCQSSGLHDWTIGYIHELYDSATAVIGEIGTNRLCRVGNESFIPIRGMEKYELWEGEEYKFSMKVKKAFARGREYWYRYGGLEFPTKQEAVIYIREKFGGLDTPSKPFSFSMKYNAKTSIKTILEKMREHGYGTRAFEK